MNPGLHLGGEVGRGRSRRSDRGLGAGGAGLAERCRGQDDEALGGDGLAAADASAVGAVLDPLERGVDLPDLGEVGGAQRLQHLVALPFGGPVLPILGGFVVERVLDPVERGDKLRPAGEQRCPGVGHVRVLRLGLGGG